MADMYKTQTNQTNLVGFILFPIVIALCKTVVILKGQKWIAQRDVRFTAVYIDVNTDSNGYR